MHLIYWTIELNGGAGFMSGLHRHVLSWCSVSCIKDLWIKPLPIIHFWTLSTLWYILYPAWPFETTSVAMGFIWCPNTCLLTSCEMFGVDKSGSETTVWSWFSNHNSMLNVPSCWVWIKASILCTPTCEHNGTYFSVYIQRIIFAN